MKQLPAMKRLLVTQWLHAVNQTATSAPVNEILHTLMHEYTNNNIE